MNPNKKHIKLYKEVTRANSIAIEGTPIANGND
jgi:hypothetical protein